jgi:hypothetical protein
MKIEPTRTRAEGRRVWLTTTGEQRIEACRAIVSASSFGKIDGATVDSFSASAIVAVYDALNEDNRAKFCALPIGKMARIAFKLLK